MSNNGWPAKPMKECSDAELLQVLESVSSRLSERNAVLKKIREETPEGSKVDMKTAADALFAQLRK